MNDTAVLLVDLRIRDRSEERLESEFPGVSGFQRVKEISSIEGRFRTARPHTRLAHPRSRPHGLRPVLARVS